MKIKLIKYIIIIFSLSLLMRSITSISEPSEFNSGLMFSDEASVMFLKKVLKSMSLKFKESNKKEGTLIEWSSSSDAQEKEIGERVNQHYFITKHCKEKKAPLPGDSALSELSCKG